jgi:hypothetical protein
MIEVDLTLTVICVALLSLIARPRNLAEWTLFLLSPIFGGLALALARRGAPNPPRRVAAQGQTKGGWYAAMGKICDRVRAALRADQSKPL